jgi:hypothetical protein
VIFLATFHDLTTAKHVRCSDLYTPHNTCVVWQSAICQRTFYCVDKSGIRSCYKSNETCTPLPDSMVMKQLPPLLSLFFQPSLIRSVQIRTTSWFKIDSGLCVSSSYPNILRISSITMTLAIETLIMLTRSRFGGWDHGPGSEVLSWHNIFVVSDKGEIRNST